MEPSYWIAIVALGLVILLVFGARYWPKSIVRREPYATPTMGRPEDAAREPNRAVLGDNGRCQAMYPPGPANVPPSAYAALVAPRILTSINNPPTAPTLHDDPRSGYNYDFYNDKYVCNTPWSLPASSNDSCAQYGIGEMMEGPPGHQFCVCEAKFKEGGKVPSRTPNADNVVIGVGAVCTKDQQCCTQYCATMPGQFSKMCNCPPGLTWDPEGNRCVGAYRRDQGPFSSMYDDHVESYRPPPPGSIPSSGKLCASNRECGLGEACTPDNFCASQLINAMSGGPSALEHADNYFNIGANCQADEQCGNNMRCLQGVCACPEPLMYEWYSRMCQCPDGALTLADGQCVKPSQVRRTFCPSVPPAFARGWQDCGLGEIFVAGSNQCVCQTNLETIHPGRIGRGGKCENSSQCASGSCQNVSGISVCVEPQEPVWDIAMAEYLP